MNNGNYSRNYSSSTLNLADFKLFNALCTNIQLPFFRLIKVVSELKTLLPIGSITVRLNLPARTINLPRAPAEPTPPAALPPVNPEPPANPEPPFLVVSLDL